MKDRVTNPLGGSLWHRGLWVTLLMGNHLCDDGDKEVNAEGCRPSVVGPMGMRRAGESPPLPTIPRLLGQPPHLIRCQPEVRDKGSFSGMTTPPRKAARYPGPPSSANSGTLEVGLLIPALLGGLKCRHFTEGPNRERQKPKVPIMLQNYSSASNHVRG